MNPPNSITDSDGKNLNKSTTTPASTNNNYIDKERENLQVIVGHGYHQIGTAQCPTLFDFADGIDTMAWLQSLI